MQALTARFMDIRKRVMDFPALGTKVKNLICVPTTSGTGAEVTPFAVVTGEDDRKYPICDYSLTPEMAIIDPNFTQDMPPKLTAATGYDALVHAIESFVSTFATDYTKAQSLHATKLINLNLEAAYSDGTNEAARENVHNGSAIAGMAFANAFLGICHSLAHQLGAQFHIPHGMANALMLTHVIAFNATDAPTKMAAFSQYRFPMALKGYAEMADALGLTEATDSDEAKVWALIDRFEELKANLDLPMSIRDAGVSWEEFEPKLDMMAAMAFDDQCTGANPRYPLIKELRQLLVDAFEGRPKKLGMTLQNAHPVTMALTEQKASVKGASELGSVSVRRTRQPSQARLASRVRFGLARAKPTLGRTVLRRAAASAAQPGIALFRM
uniref:Alcohol dehydrogenase n=2 Tax=Tetraselmis sp. GSL018 TaxID=582737 RepID=A0A061RCK2_9CHLO